MKPAVPRARMGSAVVAVLCLCACDPFNTGFDALEDAVFYEAAAKTPAPSERGDVLVMTWNVKFAMGRLRSFYECRGTRGWIREDEVVHNLQGLARKINHVQPDILLLQEMDTQDSRRLSYVDTIQWLLDNTELNFGAYASQWKADYVPSDGVGRIDSGNAILSRWPIVEGTRIALPLIDERDAIFRYFYLKRNILSVRASVGSKELSVVNIHAEAFSSDGTKKKHIEAFKAEIDRLAAAGKLVVAGGDLNALPPGSLQWHKFADDDCDDAKFAGDDYRGEESWLEDLYGAYTPAIALEAYQANPGAHFSFSGDERFFWNRKLDYLFTNGNFVHGSALTHQGASQGGMETILLSDHAPITVRLVLP